MHFQHIKTILHPFETIGKIVDSYSCKLEATLMKMRFEQKATQLANATINSDKAGVTEDRFCQNETIVSLTSYGRRIYDVFLAIESIMQGTQKPNRIILWLSEKEFKNFKLPISLQNQKKRGLEIRYCEDILSYKKLIPTLKEFPEATIITIDDDAIYGFDFVENLIISHTSNPSCIFANRVHRITKNADENLKSYLDWEWSVSTPSKNDHDLFFTGVGGVLYPPHSLDEEVFNKKIFMEICPTADDVWFNAMARLKGTRINKSFTHVANGEDYILNEAAQDCALSLINNSTENSSNDIQIKAVFEKYKIKI